MFTVKNFMAWEEGRNDMNCFDVQSFDVMARDETIIFGFIRRDNSSGDIDLLDVGCSRLIVENDTGKTIVNVEFEKHPAFKNPGEDFYREKIVAKLPSGFTWSVTRPVLCVQERNQPLCGSKEETP